MKIGFDAKRFFLNNTGLGNYSRDLIRGILNQNQDNEYFLFTPKGEIEPKTQFIKDFSNVEVVKPRGIYNLVKSYWRSVHLEKELIRNDIEFFHGLSHEIPQKSKRSPIKYVVTIHDLIFLRYPENYKSIDRKIYKKKVEYACANADKIIAISQQTKRDLIEFLGVSENKIEVVYQTCASQFQREVDESTRKKSQVKYALPETFMLSVGTIEKRKNLKLVIRAMDKMKTEIPLVVVGKKTSYFAEVEKEIEKLGLQSKVIFLENVDFEELPAIYQSASLFVYPSVFEGFGIPILEALYSKTPVIAATGSCLEEAGGSTSIYVDPNSNEELAIQIDQVIESPELQSEMKEKGYEYALNFTSEKQAKEVLGVYQKLV